MRLHNRDTAFLNRMFEAVIVDLDGTMIDTVGDFWVALNRMLVDLSLPSVERSLVKRLVGKGSEHLIKSVLIHVLKTAEAHVYQAYSAINFEENKNRVAAAEALLPVALTHYQRHYLSINGQYAVLFPGVLQGLEQLHANGLKMACLTNKPLSFAQPLLEMKGLDKFFSQVFGGDSFRRKKPDALPVLKTCESLSTKPAFTLMIGDSSNDAEAARAGGCPVVLVTYGYNHGEPVRAVDADGFVDSLTEICLNRLPLM